MKPFKRFEDHIGTSSSECSYTDEKVKHVVCVKDFGNGMIFCNDYEIGIGLLRALKRLTILTSNPRNSSSDLTSSSGMSFGTPLITTFSTRSSSREKKMEVHRFFFESSLNVVKVV